MCPEICWDFSFKRTFFFLPPQRRPCPWLFTFKTYGFDIGCVRGLPIPHSRGDCFLCHCENDGLSLASWDLTPCLESLFFPQQLWDGSDIQSRTRDSLHVLMQNCLCQGHWIFLAHPAQGRNLRVSKTGLIFPLPDHSCN